MRTPWFRENRLYPCPLDVRHDVRRPRITAHTDTMPASVRIEAERSPTVFTVSLPPDFEMESVPAAIRGVPLIEKTEWGRVGREGVALFVRTDGNPSICSPAPFDPSREDAVLNRQGPAWDFLGSSEPRFVTHPWATW